MSSKPKFPASNHNHAACVQRAMQAATSVCQQNALRFTPIRQRVLELVWNNHAPVAAYDLLKLLRQEKDNAEAPTVYRALDFLLENGLVHKIESLNAYIGCNHPGDLHTSQFLICEHCHQVVEQDNPEIDAAISAHAVKLGFMISQQTIEIMGVCSNCRT